MKSKIVMIFTGGTIAMKVDPELDAAVPGVGSNELMEMVKEVDKIADFETIDFANIPSPHMTPDLMLELSKVVKENIARDDVTGIVITHGTDTLEETAYFLELVTNSEKPIVLVGSMRNNSDLGYDGAANIAAAIYTACSPEAKSKGVLVVMNDQIYSAVDVTKTNTVAVDTFKSPELGPIGIISNKEVVFYRNIKERQLLDTEKIEKKVGLVKLAAGMEADILEFFIESGYKGIVIEALGCGNVPPAMVGGIRRAVEKDIPVVLVSRCIKGRVEPVYGYEGGGSQLKDMGVIFGGNLSGQKARIKLILALGISDDIDIIRKFF